MADPVRVRPGGRPVRAGGFRVRAGGLPYAHARETLELTLKKPADGDPSARRPAARLRRAGGEPPEETAMSNTAKPDRALNPRWPLPPRCDCGAVPESEWPACASAVAQGRQGGDADAENCERWQALAVASDWWAGQ